MKNQEKITESDRMNNITEEYITQYEHHKNILQQARFRRNLECPEGHRQGRTV